MKRNILFVHNLPTKFVQIDLTLLRASYEVHEWYERGRIINLPALAHAVKQSELVFAWFASWHSLFPLLLAAAFGRPSVLVVGGYDTANMPEIGYGNLRGGVKGSISRTTMGLATRLITNSNFGRDEVIRNAHIDPARITVVYHGLEVAPSFAEGQKENWVVTAGKVDRGNLQRKGLDPFVRAAALLPDLRFVTIGAWRDDAIDYLRSIATPNVQFTNWVPEEELYRYFGRARVYVQASWHEGFGLSLAEAMSCECVPVVTRAGALPEVVGPAGVYLDSPEPGSLAQGIRRALGLEEGWGRRARERILTEFPLACRRDGLVNVVENVAL